MRQKLAWMSLVFFCTLASSASEKEQREQAMAALSDLVKKQVEWLESRYPGAFNCLE
jgi:F0F1-type ATP synthase gamma subunit